MSRFIYFYNQSEGEQRMAALHLLSAFHIQYARDGKQRELRFGFGTSFGTWRNHVKYLAKGRC